MSEAPDKQVLWGEEITVKDAERFLDSVRNNKDVQFIFAVIAGLGSEAAENYLGRPKDVTSDDLHFARGYYCAAKAMSGLPGILQEFVEEHEAYLKAQSDTDEDA